MANIFLSGEPTTAKELAKTERYLSLRERIILQHNPRTTLARFRLDIPGPIKTNLILDSVFHDCAENLQQTLQNKHYFYTIQEQKFHKTGDWLLINAAITPRKFKRLTTHFETEHPLGQLCDFAVFHYDQICIKAVHRSDLGLPPKKCLICDYEAEICQAKKQHSLEALQTKISELVMDYFETNPSRGENI